MLWRQGRRLNYWLAFVWLTAPLWFTSFSGFRTQVHAAASAGAGGGGAESVLIGEIGRQNNQSLLWGPYKPNLYFGVRPRIPKSLFAGLMWGRVDTYSDIQTCWSSFLFWSFVYGSWWMLTDCCEQRCDIRASRTRA